MSKILLNPDNGAEIKDIWYKEELFFNSKENDIFEPGSVRQFDDENVANFLKTLFAFLYELTLEEAQKYMEDQKNAFQCDKCDFHTHVKAQYQRHQQNHQREEQLKDLGIPIVKKSNQEIEKTLPTNTQQQIDQEANREGLIGEGLTNDAPLKSTIMS